MENKSDFPKMLFVIKLIHSSLAMMLIALGAGVIWLNVTNPAGSLTPENEIITYAPALLLLFAFPVSMLLFRIQVKKANLQGKELRDKLATFQTAHLIRMALFEVPGLFSIVVSFLTGTNYNLIILAIVLLMFLFLMPSASRLTLDLGLSNEEKTLLK